MNEFERARLRLFLTFFLFAVFIFCVVFGIVKVCRQLNPPDVNQNQPEIIAAEQNISPVKNKAPIEKAVAKKTVPSAKEKTDAQEFKLDDSKAFRGILKSWRRYKLPRCGILVDVDSGRVLWSYHADKVVPIASLSKMLTVYIALEEIKKSRGVITLDNKVKITKSSGIGREGSFGFVPGQVFSVRDLMKAATVRSANDAASSLAVYFGNGEASFVKMMNQEAQKLGMKNSRFLNPHGLPAGKKDNVSTMNDLIILSLKLLKNPDYMQWAKMNGAKIGNKTIVSTNNLMRKRRCPGVDGMKTGYTRRAGFCLAFSCLRKGRRMVGVVAGFPSSTDRENFVTALLNWAYR